MLGVAYAIETYGLIYNHQLLDQYCQMENAVIEKPEDIRGFATLKAVAQDIQARKEELGVQGAFTSAGMDSSSDWRFKTHLASAAPTPSKAPICPSFITSGICTFKTPPAPLP